MKKTLAFILSLCLLFSLAGCGAAAAKPVPAKADTGPSQISETVPPSDAPPTEKAEALALSAAKDYDEVYAALKAAYTVSYGYHSGMFFTEDAVAAETPAAAPAAEPTASAETGAAGGDYSQTNVQVEGIDEGDIVKTDGEYIYILSSYDLIIVKADGANTVQLSNTILGQGSYTDGESTYTSESKYPSEMFISGDTLAVISGYYYNYSDWNANKYESREVTYVDFYDVSDPASPKKLSSLGQDGYLIASRMLNGKVYLVTSYGVYDYREHDPYDFVPCLYDGEERTVMEAGCIILPPYVETSRYTVAGEYDIATAAAGQSLSVLGGGDLVYMNASNLYIARSYNDETVSEPYTDSIYKVEDYSYRSVTDITRFDLSGGGLTLASACKVDGGLDSQFSMDEKDGYLRIVTTQSGYSYKLYTDEDKGFTNYVYGDTLTSNGLSVIDVSDMTVKAGLDGLAENEYVYSVRFDGDIVYFCTFRQTDPLFAADLSDPLNPVILSELKITGFSDYLHVWSEGRLFGLGMEADASTGATECLKLVMFDASDPKSVSVMASLKLDDYYWSEALDNHKAALVDSEKNLIAFPVGDELLIFSYDDAGGFTQRAAVDFGDMGWYQSRALYIGGYMYAANAYSVAVLDMSSFTPVANLSLSVG